MPYRERLADGQGLVNPIDIPSWFWDRWRRRAKTNPNGQGGFASCWRSTEVQGAGTWWSCAAGREGGKKRPSSGEQAGDLLTEETIDNKCYIMQA